MGWQVDKLDKRRRYGSRVGGGDARARYLAGVHGVAIDMAAVFRNLVSDGNPAALTPATAVHARFWPVLMPYLENARVVVLAFDGSNINEARLDFYKTKRYKASDREPFAWEIRHPETGIIYTRNEYPISDSDIPRIVPDEPLPGSWSSVYNNPGGKKRLFTIIADILETKILRRGKHVNGETTYIIDRPDGSRRQYPDRLLPPECTYSEGDNKAIWWGLFLESQPDIDNVLLWSIDWDVVIGSTLYDHKKPFDVLISTIFCSEEEDEMFEYDETRVEHTYDKAELTFGSAKTSAIEVVPIAEHNAGFPDRASRYDYAFVSVCLGQGTDYTDGLSQFGYIASRLRKARVPRMFAIEHKGFQRRIRFNVDAFVKMLSKLKRFERSVKTECALALNREILKGIWYIMYFGGYCSRQDPAGPAPLHKTSTVVLNENAATVPSIFRWGHGRVHFYEEAAIERIEDMPCDADIFFGQRHAEALEDQ